MSYRDDVVRAGKLLFERGWIAASDGNISVRLDEGRILATPAGMCKGMLAPAELVICDLEGRKLEGVR